MFPVEEIKHTGFCFFNGQGAQCGRRSQKSSALGLRAWDMETARVSWTTSGSSWEREAGVVEDSHVGWREVSPQADVPAKRLVRSPHGSPDEG